MENLLSDIGGGEELEDGRRGLSNGEGGEAMEIENSAAKTEVNGGKADTVEALEVFDGDELENGAWAVKKVEEESILHK